jgi:hypothetical protein
MKGDIHIELYLTHSQIYCNTRLLYIFTIKVKLPNMTNTKHLSDPVPSQ